MTAYPARGRRRGCAALASSDRSTSLRVHACSAASRSRSVTSSGVNLTVTITRPRFGRATYRTQSAGQTVHRLPHRRGNFPSDCRSNRRCSCPANVNVSTRSTSTATRSSSTILAPTRAIHAVSSVLICTVVGMGLAYVVTALPARAAT